MAKRDEADRQHTINFLEEQSWKNTGCASMGVESREGK
jgi:hypothetical protein